MFVVFVGELVAATDAIAKTVTRLGWDPSEVPQETADIVRQLVDEGFLVPKE